MTLLEFYGQLDELGFAGRPDDSGIRGKGMDRKVDRRLATYPYDRDVFYGQPSAYDRGNAGGSNLNHSLIPKDTSKFSLTLLDLPLQDIEEIVGYPVSFVKSGESARGTAIPGASAGWATNPSKNWDEPEDIEELNIGYSDHSIGDDYDLELDPRGPGYGDFPLVDPSQFGKFDAHVISPDPWSAINRNFSQRLNNSVIPQATAWDRVTGLRLDKDENWEE